MGEAFTVADLSVTYTGPPPVVALDHLSLSVNYGECLGVLGESGSGKSTLANALLGLLSGAHVRGELRLGTRTLHDLDQAGWREVRWRRIALCLQSTAALNPVLRVREQLTEPLRIHCNLGHEEARDRALASLASVGLGDWASDRYPRELSGGQRRLVLLAMALACDPEVILLDEPTAGLDPVTRQKVVEILLEQRDRRGRALMLLGHDIDAMELLANRVAVLYRGWMAEAGATRQVLHHARHPYTWALINARPTLASVKDLRGIRGEPPNPLQHGSGCPFLERCTQSIPGCNEVLPEPMLVEDEGEERFVACVRGGLATVLRATSLCKSYTTSGRWFGRERVPAVSDASLTVREGEVVGVVGANGAGKSTLAMMLLRLLEPDSGELLFEGADLGAMDAKSLKAVRRRAQMLFQDPFEALSQRMTVREAVSEPLAVQLVGNMEFRDAMVRNTLAATRLPSDDTFLQRHTHELSGGQLQRVALARALVLEPKLLIADEPVSMLDPSEKAKMLQLLKYLQVERGMAMVIVSHDLAVVLRVADRVVVLDSGRVVEEGSGSRLLAKPRHSATRLLLAAAGRDALFAEAERSVRARDKASIDELDDRRIIRGVS